MRFRADSEAAVWLSLDSEDPDERRFRHARSRRGSFHRSRARRASIANDVENKTLAAMREWLADAKQPKIVHDPKLFQLAGRSAFGRRSRQDVRFAGIRHAMMLYSYLLRPTTANHAFAEVVLAAL